MKSRYYKKLKDNPSSHDVYMAIKHDGYYIPEMDTFIIFYNSKRYSIKENDEYHAILLADFIADKAKRYLIDGKISKL